LSAFHDLVPLLLPAEGEGLSVRRLKVRLEGRVGRGVGEKHFRCVVRTCLAHGTIHAEVVKAGPRHQYRLWRGPRATGAV